MQVMVIQRNDISGLLVNFSAPYYLFSALCSDKFMTYVTTAVHVIIYRTITNRSSCLDFFKFSMPWCQVINDETHLRIGIDFKILEV
jgi:hypothetical protein